MFSTDDTIVAIATPPGRGGLGVVRLSGPASPFIAKALLGRELVPRQATVAHVRERGDGEATAARPLDQVVATYFAAPHSYTQEDVVEITAHGSPPLLTRIVDLALEAGARLAEPGEFTLRAYLHGRIDLVQAEAVRDLIEAVTPLQARSAMDQLEGTLTTAITAIERRLFDLAAKLEASLDFPDEGFHFTTPDQVIRDLTTLRDDVRALITEGRAGRAVREGRLVVILGAPNAGKSSLFNALVGSARAIVTDVPGTTRDLLTETVDLAGVAVTLVDTAGLREAGDAIEEEGVRRAVEARDAAALRIFVVDGSRPLDRAASEKRFPSAAGAQLVVASKADLPWAWSEDDLAALGGDVLQISALTGLGLEELRRRVVFALTDREDWRDPPRVTNLRHIRLLAQVEASVERAVAALAEGASEEVVLVEIDQARRALEEISGRTTADDLLHHIFGTFCIGK